MNKKRLLCRRQDLPKRFPRPFDLEAGKNGIGLSGVEIGVFKGKHARVLVRRLKPRVLFLVDPYQPYDKRTDAQLSNACLKAKKQLQTSIDAGVVSFIKKASKEASAQFPDNNFDFIYIDGNHSYEAVQCDIASWWPKIKLGGIFGGHDFDIRCPGVIKAVIEFAVRESQELKVKTPDWWIRKK